MLGGKRDYDAYEAPEAFMDFVDYRGSLRRARLARAPDDGAQGASGLESDLSWAGVPVRGSGPLPVPAGQDRRSPRTGLARLV